jgi:hypothetical protein
MQAEVASFDVFTRRIILLNEISGGLKNYDWCHHLERPNRTKSNRLV